MYRVGTVDALTQISEILSGMILRIVAPEVSEIEPRLVSISLNISLFRVPRNDGYYNVSGEISCSFGLNQRPPGDKYSRPRWLPRETLQWLKKPQ